MIEWYCEACDFSFLTNYVANCSCIICGGNVVVKKAKDNENEIDCEGGNCKLEH